MKIKPTLYAIGISCLSCFLFSCSSKNQAPPSLDGVWESLGYGRILKIDAENFVHYDRTKISCLPFQEGSLSEYGAAIQLKNDTLTISSGISVYQYIRSNKLPDLCSEEMTAKKKTDPLYNFEVLANTIQENYAYFQLNQLNWDSLYTAASAKLSPKSTEADLYLALEGLVSSLKDNHGYLEATDEVYEQVEALSLEEEGEEETLEEYGDFQIARMVAEHYLVEDLTKDSWLIHWGKMKDNVGYIQVKAMWLYGDLNLSDSLVKENGFVDTYVDAFFQLPESHYIDLEVKGVSQLLDQVMTDLSDTEYLIVDVRFNGGGQDAVSLEILRQFNKQRKLVANKRAIYKNGFTSATPIYLEAHETAYQKPIYLLTSQQSASATDMLALASLELPNIQRIGSHSNGALSDALEKQLPNGWYFSISNLEYRDNKGICYENIGIPVDVELHYPEERQPFFRSVADDLAGDKEKVMTAIEKLRLD